MSKEKEPQKEQTIQTEIVLEEKKEAAPVKQLTPVQKFNQYLETYKQNILPDLLEKHNIEPAQFVQMWLE